MNSKMLTWRVFLQVGQVVSGQGGQTATFWAFGRVLFTAAFCHHFHPVFQEAQDQTMARFSEFVRYVYWDEHLCPELPHPNLPTKAGGTDNPSLPTDQEHLHHQTCHTSDHDHDLSLWPFEMRWESGNVNLHQWYINITDNCWVKTSVMYDYVLLTMRGLEVKSLGFGLKLCSNPGFLRYSMCNLREDT